MRPIGRLHVLTDGELQTRFTHVELARLAIAGGADTIQFRQKTGSTLELIRTAREMMSVCEEAGATLIVNDRIDVAIAAGAHGVHLGQGDFPIPLARELLGKDRIVGGSASTREEARKCLAEGADYIGFGPVYPTDSKADAAPAAGIDLLLQVANVVGLPVIAIGGICAENLPDVFRAGAHGVAVISAVCCQTDPREASRSLRRAVERSVAGRPLRRQGANEDES
jgi:thiamine-phosphate pyrophosphorylase